MRTLSFSNERSLYRIEGNGGKYVYTGPGLIPVFELLWTTLDNAPGNDLKKADYKRLKKIKDKLRAISDYKDLDGDSRILQANPWPVQLEDAEYDLVVQLLSSTQFASTRISDTIVELWDLIDSAPVA